MVALLLLSLVMTPPVQSQPPRDRIAAPGTVVDPAAREAELQKRIAATPTGVAAYLELSKLQENRGAYDEAEATLQRARLAEPRHIGVVQALAALYNRQGNFDRAIEMLEAAEQLDPTDPAAPQIVATFYWEKAYKDHKLLPTEQLQYVMNGIAATDRALALKPDYVNALTYKNLLLRMRANLETDPVLKQQLLAEADTLRNRAIELNKQRTAINSADSGVPLPPPPPPPPGDPQARVPSLEGMRQPTKIRDVRPVYPPEALAARIQGVVIVEVSLDTVGHVRNATIVRSIPELDDAALTAVRQWEFTPAISNGTPVPVNMTVTVNFSLQ